MRGMIWSALVSVMMGIQPVCTESTFSRFIEPSTHGDVEVVARAIFEDYLEQVAKLGSTPHERQTPVEFVIEQRNTEIRADVLFDSLLDSLALLSEDSSWSDAIKQVRRYVLLSAREANNPWPNTQWYDIALVTQTNPQLLDNIDSFLLKHVDDDRIDRFAATIALLEGNKETCVEAERKTMQRWAIYDKLIEPFENNSSLAHSYPAIPGGGEVARIVFRIIDNIKDPKQKEVIGNLFTSYKTMHEQQKRVIVSMVKNTRINDEVDPLSSGCGTFDKTRILVLQKTAEMQEQNASAIQLMIQALTPEQRQQLELEE